MKNHEKALLWLAVALGITANADLTDGAVFWEISWRILIVICLAVSAVHGFRWMRE